MKTLKNQFLHFLVCAFLIGCFISCKKNPVEKVKGSTEEFIDYTIDGTSYSYNAPGDTLFIIGGDSTESSDLNNHVRISCHGYDGNFTLLEFSRLGIGLNSQQPFDLFGVTALFGGNDALLGAANVTITEYGAIGEYIAGHFTGALIQGQNQLITHNLVCSFRVRRTH